LGISIIKRAVSEGKRTKKGGDLSDQNWLANQISNTVIETY
jgi:hypothetical protein